MEQSDTNDNRGAADSAPMHENPIVINYAEPDITGQDSSRLYRWAIGLAIFPPVGGIAIFLLYVATRADELVRVGIKWLGVGIVFVTASGIVALIHAAKDWSARIRSKGKIVFRLLGVIALIASNFLIAALIIYLVAKLLHP